MSGALGKYRLEVRLGGGGMAEVFNASTQGAEGFSRKVAIKRVLPGYSDNPAFAQMFIDEAKISSRLVHPNIVSVLDFDRDADARLFLVMELVDGKDLDALASTGPLPVPVVIFVISEVLRGLGYAHDLPSGADLRGIVHRDVSPHNVLLSWEGAVKVSDFGIAKARSASEATASVFIKGKPAYMSPEQANGERLDGRSDLFAVGIMLWEMLVGRRLFVAEDTRATLAAVLFGQIPRPRSIRGDVPKDLERVVMKLLERDLAARYPTAEAAIAELLECADAPKSGREALIRMLAERFPNEVRMRQSAVRARGASVPPPQPQVPPGYAATVAGVPAHAMPSLSAMMSAPTGTLGPAPRTGRTGRMGRGLIIGLVTLAVGAIAFGIVASVVRKDGTAGVGSGSAVALASGAADPALPVDATPPVDDAAAVTDAAPAPPPADAPPVADAAAPVDAPKKDASSPQPSHGVGKRLGRLEVKPYNTYYTVYLDGKKVGDTPVERDVPVGKHTLRLVNTDKKIDKKLPIVITETAPTLIEN